MTRPVLWVPPTEILSPPLAIRFRRSCCPVLEQTVGLNCQCIASEILHIPNPKSTHITHLLPQLIPSAHTTPRRNTHPHDPFHITPHLVVYSNPWCLLDQLNLFEWNIRSGSWLTMHFFCETNIHSKRKMQGKRKSQPWKHCTFFKQT